MKTTFFLFAIGTLLLGSCAGTRGMSVQVMRPAQITVGKDIQSVAILNRGIPSAQLKTEEVLTLERKNQDKQLTEECVRGLNDLLATSSRFQIKRCDSTMFASNPSSLDFGQLLNWTEVDSLCKKYEVEALLVLEYFDTDFSIYNPVATAATTVTNVLNGNMNSTINVTGTAKANAGWRIYYPATKTIVFEERFKWSKTWTESSTNPIDAIGRLIKPNDALMSVSYVCGNEFASSIVPLFYWENREMFKGKKDQMQRAERMALSKDWEGAYQIWQEQYESSTKKKVRAHAAFNAALAQEVLGNLNDALKWSEKSYVENGNSEALRYSNILDQRIREQGKIDVQLGE